MSRYYTPIRRGEYDLVNISLLNYDPNTGRSFDDCYSEWDAARIALLKEFDASSWWQFLRRFRLKQKAFALRTHRGY